MKFDPAKPHAVIYGSADMRYLQDDVYYAANGDPVKVVVSRDGLDETDESLSDLVSSAAMFLRSILSEPRSKSVIYAEAERNNQVWEDVTQAAKDLKIQKFKAKNTEMWRLPQE